MRLQVIRNDWITPLFRASLLPGLAGIVLTCVAAAAQAATPTASLSIREHRFEPTEVEVPAGQKIELHVINRDNTPEEFESTELHREKVVPAGQEVVVYIGPLRAGTYEFFGDFNPTTARGRIVAK
ncbi:MAG: cupredoxin domain-containing protein [Acetobacteraceae bacterium]|nr:cupredoxin domain-containing protein [Acetobacteraceae bacterium]